MSKTRQDLEAWLKDISLPAMSKVLDIGGSQLPVKKRIQPTEGAEFTILDLEQPHKCEQKPDIIWDMNKIIAFGYDICKEHQEAFDIAFCLEVSEYLTDPLSAFYSINWFLKEGGILYISSHFLYPCHNPPEEDCLRYTPNGILKLLQESGFEILENTPRLMSDEAYSYLRQAYSIDGFRPSKELDNHHVIGNLIKCKKI